LVSYFALIISLVAVFLAQQAGTTGGEIRHTEIRKDYKASNTTTDGQEDDD
jgi:hypothetical protein